MPIINFEGPHMTIEQKAKIVKEFTAAASETLNIPKEAFTVLIKENNMENIGVAGELLSEKMKK